MDFENPTEELLFAIAFIDHPGVNGDFKAQMATAIKNGADVNGNSDDGQTPLTAAIAGGTGSPSAVSILLQFGADPSKRDNNGWTPWGVCISRIPDPVVEEEMTAIKDMLIKENADRSDEYPLNFQKAILEEDISTVKKYLEEDIDLTNPIISPLRSSILTQNIEIINALLIAGAEIDEDDEETESPLIYAASSGYHDIVELLLKYGADLTKYAWGDKRCTAEFMARENGHDSLAEFLLQRMSTTPSKTATKYKILYDKKTNGINYGLTTDDIVNKLEQWDEKYSISISEVAHNSFAVRFGKLPSKLNTFVSSIYDFCPDIIDQGYGCMDDMVSLADESGTELSHEILDLIKGIDFTHEDFGKVILGRDLKKQQMIRLWWD